MSVQGLLGFYSSPNDIEMSITFFISGCQWCCSNRWLSDKVKPQKETLLPGLTEDGEKLSYRQ